LFSALFIVVLWKFALTAVSESSVVSRSKRQTIRYLPGNLTYLLNYHLCDPIPSPDQERFLPPVHEDNLDLAPIVCIYGSWGVEDADTMVDCQATSRPDLGLKANGQSNGYACWDEKSFTWWKVYLAGYRSVEINP